LIQGNLPRVPPTEPANALATFHVKPGFRLELRCRRAARRQPRGHELRRGRAALCRRDARLPERRPERLGRIRLLEDTDGDDVSRRALLRGGTALANGGDLLGGRRVCRSDAGHPYFKDTDGDGKADVRETIFTGFASDYAPFATNKLNVQALMNSFNWSLDNRNLRRDQF
jgi:hypothetical protein